MTGHFANIIQDAVNAFASIGIYVKATMLSDGSAFLLEARNDDPYDDYQHVPEYVKDNVELRLIQTMRKYTNSPSPIWYRRHLPCSGFNSLYGMDEGEMEDFVLDIWVLCGATKDI